ncbi:MAG: DUF4242 domain-containing protein [Chitinophagaceae bacterium]
MKLFYAAAAMFILVASYNQSYAQTDNAGSTKKTSKTKVKKFYLDIHELGPGNVTADAVAGAHKKDLATEKQFGTHFVKYWVDEKEGLVYCLSTAPDTAAIRKTHEKAHGLLPSHIYEVSEGEAAKIKNMDNLYLDVHELGAGNVTAVAVAEAHKKDLATQQKYGVNFINYWVDEKEGLVFCLAEAKDSQDLINTHKEAHGLVPTHVMKVKQGE